MDGTLQFGQSDGELPKKGDILSAINAVQVYDVDDKQIIMTNIFWPAKKCAYRRLISMKTAYGLP